MVREMRKKVSAAWLSLAAGVLLSSLVGMVIHTRVSNSIEAEAATRFANYAGYMQTQLATRIKSYGDLLNDTRCHLETVEAMSESGFHQYVTRLDLARNYPAVDAMNFAYLVAGDELPGFSRALENELRGVVGATFTLRIAPPGARGEYLLTSYIEPHPRSSDAYGIDLMRLKFAPMAHLRARDHGGIYTSGLPVFALSTPGDVHLGLRAAVDRGKGPASTSAQRRAAYVGTVGLAFSVPKLLRGLMHEVPLRGLRVTLRDIGAVSGDGTGTVAAEGALFDSQRSPAHPAPPPAAGEAFFTIAMPLDFHGRPWRIVYSVRRQELLSEVDRAYPGFLTAFGSAAAFLLYVAMHLFGTSRRAALRLAHEMTVEVRESQARLQQSHIKLRSLADHAYEVKEMERKRIAREIHDDLGQNLLVLRIETELLVRRTRAGHGVLHRRAHAKLEQIDQTIKSVRHIINDLRPAVLDLGLAAAVEWQVNHFRDCSGIECELNDDHEEMHVTDHCATAIFRILQESLTNVQRHAQATRVVVTLRQYSGWLTLSVTDNGRGLPPGALRRKGSFGLVGIEERASILGGTCAVYNEQCGGVTVMVTAPASAMPTSLSAEKRERESGSAVV